MKITAKLAYSQLKINRLRTAGALAAIALSTALMTVVCSFVASGNAMAVQLLGADYGNYGNAYKGLLLLPAIFFGLMIVIMSVVVISNVFRVSAEERMAQFGILKCVGATGAQISSVVLYESVFLSAVGIPVGLVLGLGLAFVGIRVTNGFLGELNALADMMVNKINLSVSFVVSWQALLVAALICFFTVLFSAWRPGRKAAKASAVDSVRGAGTITIRKTKPGKRERGIGQLTQKLFGCEGVLASKTIQRNRRSFRATVVALATGVVLFVALGSLSQQANALECYMQPTVEETVIADYSSARITRTNEKTGRVESVYRCPLDSDVGNTVAEKLSAYDGKSVYGLGLDLETYYTVLPAEVITGEMQGVLADTPQANYEIPVEIIPVDAYHYKALCEKAGVAVGSTILLNHYRYNDNGSEVDVTPYLPTLRSVTLKKADGSEKTWTIDGVLTQAEMPQELFYFNTNPIRLVVQQAEVRGYSWYATPDDEAAFIAYANTVLAEAFSADATTSYQEDGFSTRAYKTNDYAKVMNIANVLVLVFMYSFVVLLMLIGFTNVVSTMFTNVVMRAREFAVLQSVGMTQEGLRRMLALESILCSLKALAVGLPVGVAITYLINLPIRQMFPVPYAFPWLWVLLCTVGVLGITWGTTRCATHTLRNQNIIETIRTQSGR
ncbi:MAG: ABC transporter permease [Gemmiger sp.]|nr:ABC transporter permease [Gemmiger sp.]